MKSREVDPEKKFWFIVLSSITIIIVGTGWFFSFRNLWHSTNLSFSFKKVDELQQGMGNIANDLKEGIQEESAALDPALLKAAAEISEEKKQAAAAKEIVGEIMKDNLNSANESITNTNSQNTEQP